MNVVDIAVLTSIFVGHATYEQTIPIANHTVVVKGELSNSSCPCLTTPRTISATVDTETVVDLRTKREKLANAEVCQAVLTRKGDVLTISHLHPARATNVAFPFLGTIDVDGKPVSLHDRRPLETGLVPGYGTLFDPETPDTILLVARISEHVSLPEFPVRPRTKMRLSFRYLIVPGSECTSTMEMVQYRSGLSGDYVGPRQTIKLETIGRWTEVRQSVLIADDSASIIMFFRMQSETETGEVRIENLRMVPFGSKKNP